MVCVGRWFWRAKKVASLPPVVCRSGKAPRGPAVCRPYGVNGVGRRRAPECTAPAAQSHAVRSSLVLSQLRRQRWAIEVASAGLGLATTAKRNGAEWRTALPR